jgi:iron complex transport system ATP-binding protein
MSLAVNDLAFGYPGKRVGQDVSFTLQAGEILAILGPNGGGKTTLFRTVLGLLDPMGGTIAIEGTDIAQLSRSALAKRIGYVPQAQLGLFPFQVEDVVVMGRTAHIGLFATPSGHDREIARAMLDTLGIAHLARAVYTQISGGERQMTLIARALAQEPRILVMDEPTANLDYGNQMRVLRQVATLARRGIAVLMSTHDPDQAFLCADRALMLHGGTTLKLGAPQEVITSDTLRLVYDIDVQIARLADVDGRARHVCVPAFQPRQAL